jgi:hypothetical protein
MGKPALQFELFELIITVSDAENRVANAEDLPPRHAWEEGELTLKPARAT